MNAGAIPIIADRNIEHFPAGRALPTRVFPAAALPEHNSHVLSLLWSWDPAGDPLALSRLTISEFLARHRRAQPSRSPLLLCLDQAEDLYRGSPAPRAGRMPLLGQLLQALEADPQVNLLVSVQDDRLADLLRDMGLDRRHDVASQHLPALGRAAAVEAVRRPLKGTRLSLSPGTAEALVDELLSGWVTDDLGRRRPVRESTVHPLHLQAVCAWLWQHLPGDLTSVTVQDAHRIGSVDLWLATAAVGSAVRGVADYLNMDAGRLCGWIQDTFVTPEGARRPVGEGPQATAGMPNNVLRTLHDHRLLKAETRSGSRWFELPNDRVVPPLRLAVELLAAPSAGQHAPAPADRLRAATNALADGEPDLASWHARQVLRQGPGRSLRAQAEAETLLGDISYSRDEVSLATDHYLRGASLLEALRDTAAAGALLAAVGRLHLLTGDTATAVVMLRSAVSRLPGNSSVAGELMRALSAPGRTNARTARSPAAENTRTRPQGGG
ncbi:hypothetical protein PYR91_18890 [Sphaerisporangium sp. TRM90804]|nr:hypothetical protein [Sphaerisporangium sp. TRM90804]MDH2427498.1 hypothetical protein [Sphaerisporangium sp. TRM90804]